MKKCPKCNSENPDGATLCGSCQNALPNPLPPPSAKIPLLPYFLSYVLVASGAFLFNHVLGQRSTVAFPQHVVMLNTTLNAQDLAAKLVQAGIPRESVLIPPNYRASAWQAIEYYFAHWAVGLAAFLAFAEFLRRFFENKRNLSPSKLNPPTTPTATAAKESCPPSTPAAN